MNLSTSAVTVQFLVMFTAEWHSKRVTDFPSKSSEFDKFEMVASHGDLATDRRQEFIKSARLCGNLTLNLL